MIETTEQSKDSNDAEDEDDALLPVCFNCERHRGKILGINCTTQCWRVRDRMKTVSVALVLCLNIGVDPPDVVKIDKCARVECWINPASYSPGKALEMISYQLQKQYERWQPRARYRHSLDPTMEDVKKLCTSLRRNAKEERVLFHYNGHGVPRPTANGEIWVFNRNFTQYIPLSIYDLQTWMGAPSIYVYDCSNAGIIVNSFHTFADQHELEVEHIRNRSGSTVGHTGGDLQAEDSRSSPSPSTGGAGTTTYRNCIQLAACAADQLLPMNPNLPADLFTSCLTTPVKMALRWFTLQSTSKLVPEVTEELIEKIPGQLNDRRTMMGELNWIFTAITDTIAWNTLRPELFQKLFRQDLLVASLFRNFLLAERILRAYDCTPISSPALPPSYRHPMWSAWDLALDQALAQLPDVLEKGKPFQHSPFFEEQLTAFQVWLEGSTEQRSPPEQLPIVLQVLLSQVHRLRALELLGHFVDLGPWAVNLALSVGIFPYVLKLLQSSAKELRPCLVFIWAKIVAVDGTCQIDLIREQGHKYFLIALQDTNPGGQPFKGNHRTYAAFVLASIVHNFPNGQSSALQGQLVSICLDQLNDDSNPLLRQWLAICLGHLWQNYEQARWSGVRDNANEKLYPLLSDPYPEVRAAAVYALGTFISSVKQRSDHANNIDRSTAMHLFSTVSNDMSPLVRMELIAALQWMVLFFESQFAGTFLQLDSPERTTNPMKRVLSTSNIIGVGKASVMVGFYQKLWNGFIALSKDPFPEVASMAQKVVDYVRADSAKEVTVCDKSSHHYGSAASVSLPPSPNTRVGYLAGESPPTHGGIHGPSDNGGSHHRLANQQTPLAMKKRIHAVNDSPAAGPDYTDSPDKLAYSQSSSHSLSSSTAPLKPIVGTQYIEWSVSFFAQPSKRMNEAKAAGTDHNSYEFLIRKSRWLRNKEVRAEGRTQRMKAIFKRLDVQSWSCRTQHAPTFIKLNPYDEQVAFAYKDRVIVVNMSTEVTHTLMPQRQSIYDSSSNLSSSSTSSGYHSLQHHGSHRLINQSFLEQHHPTPSQSQQPSLSSFPHQLKPSNEPLPAHGFGNHALAVTSLEFLNAHDVGVIMAGYSDSTIRLWRPKETSDENQLLSAWHGLLDFNTSSAAKVSCSEAAPAAHGGLVLAWHQRTQTIMAAGEAKYIRLWDAEREMRICDIPSGSDTAVLKLSCAPNGIFAAGFYDGSVRIFDRRCPPAETRCATIREHINPVLAICLRDDCESLVTADVSASVRLYDIRKAYSSVQNWSAGTDVSAMAIHTSADILACATSQIVIYGLDGVVLSSGRSNEGFMAPRKGVASCLSFHKYKLNLAAGYNDNTAAVLVP
ncbi:regulatory-associated protein of mTOR [Anopheles gambiae]|uniref:Raptor N-terminal CASPase-like domain-containing protein n=2 Tax=gambiae species complex TaxID=44542 RepID=A0A1S4H2T0_ANOGA|nr:regulatory-associated protein of mTOR [Anopheles coluzzii]XP_061517571.1 regulatory-associated protein of mTOR [Anopheles gambiae]